MLPVKNVDFADDVRGLVCSALAAFVWLCWDVVVHFDIEVECIWLRPSSWVKWTYILVRYAPIVHEAVVLTLCSSHHFSYAECKGWIYYELIFMQLLTTLVEVILVIRLYVLYNRGWVITVVLGFTFLSETVAMVTTLALVFDKITFLPSCLITDIPDTFAGFWMSSLVFETILFGLTLYKLYQSIRGRPCRRSIMLVVLRDGTWAFSVIFVAMLVNTVMYRFCTTPLIGVGYYWALGVMSFAGSHLLLNLHRLSIPDNTSMNDIPLDERSVKAQGDHRTFLTTAIDAPEAYESLPEASENLSESELPSVHTGDSV